ncbi:DMT family transporter [Nocardia sp. NPDC052566]|uniref:DMT family transporter n=1 Tax=Nocardia sp. NPDC052566 TaxID=3364330 RepID=UPI0037C7CB5B
MSRLALVYLLIAIVCEVAATMALKATDGFKNIGPVALVVVGYGGAFFALSLTLRDLSVGVAYALWSAIGTVLLTILAAVIYKQQLGLTTLLGMALTIGGVVLINLGSSNVH